MEKPFWIDKEFLHEDFTKNPLPKGEYEECIFTGCNFSNSFLDNQNFMECRFLDCDLSNANIKHTIFKEVLFKDSKLIGLRFEDCNPFLLSVQFENSNLSLSSFYGLRLKGTVFNDCILRESDFTETDLTEALFSHCDLEKTVFQRTVLEKADLSSSYKFEIDPEQNKLGKAKFSKDNLMGLLKKYDIVVT